MTHPSDDTLAAFVERTLDPKTAEAVAAHIDECTTCRQIVVAAVRGRGDETLEVTAATRLERAAWSESATLPVGSVAAPTAELGVVDPTRYTSRTVLAEGGMGRISIAYDRQVGRKVALKELLSDHPELRARFEREVQLTARLEHPSIVTIHEAGRWPTGEPFYVMRLVPGQSLWHAITSAKSPADRLALVPAVVSVADALAYAHGQRVVHRDLKPNNVMIGEFGEAVVIDWGLAKQLVTSRVSTTEIASSDVETRVGAVLGTPAYMPPEQATGQLADERADVYAIGAILYHVIAGVAPFTGDGDAVIAAVKVGPPPPLADRAAEVAPDLLAIVARAMARDPAERYPTARELADDLRRFQTGQLVGAHHYSARELWRRWVARHRVEIAVGLAAVVALVAVGAFSLARIVRSEHVAETERAAADHNRGDAEDLVGFLLFDLQEPLRASGRFDLLRPLAAKASEYYAKLPETADPHEQHRRATAHFTLAEMLVRQGDAKAATAEANAALAIAERVLAANTDPEHARADLAHAHTLLGDALRTAGDRTGALVEYRLAIESGTQAAALAPHELVIAQQNAGIYNRIGDTLRVLGKLDEAATELRLNVTLLEQVTHDHPEVPGLQISLAGSHEGIGNILATRGDFDGALAEYHAMLAIADALVQREGDGNLAALNALAMAHEHVAEVLRVRGDLDGALAANRTQLAVTERIATSDPANPARQQDLAHAHLKLARISIRRKDVATAFIEARAAAEIADHALGKTPTDALAMSQDAETHGVLGQAYDLDKQFRPALDEYRAELAIQEKLAAIDPNNAERQHSIAVIHTDIADARHGLHDRGGAAEDLRAAVAIFEKLAATSSSPRATRELAEAKKSLDTCLREHH